MRTVYADVKVTYKGKIEFQVPEDVFDLDGFAWDYVVDSLECVPEDIEYLGFDDYTFDYEWEDN